MKKNLLLGFLLSTTFIFAQSPEELANAQLEAYNNRDIEAFLVPYSDTVKVFEANRNFLYQGKEEMRKQYEGFFENTPELNCLLINRIAVGSTVIEHEEVTFGDGRKGLFIVMYKVAEGKIQEVHFVDGT